MDPIRKIPKKFTKKFVNKVINGQYFHSKTGLEFCKVEVGGAILMRASPAKWQKIRPTPVTATLFFMKSVRFKNSEACKI